MGLMQNLGLEPAALAASLAKAKVLVVGDVMLDRYWFGDVSRISPEAPVPVAKIGRSEERAGGAANVARNIAGLGGKATILSVVGDDEAADALERLLGDDGIVTSFKRDANIATTVKLRVVARQQQLIRLDFEDAPSHEILADKLEEFTDIVAAHDVVILSDYGKGGLTHVAEMIQLARAAGKPVLIDPKGDDYSKYAGATLLTPNRSEFRQVAGSWKDEASLTAKAQALRAELNLDALLVTRSEEGMTLFRADGALHQPTFAREVYDVSGAGDTVIGTLGLALAAGQPLPVAMNLANAAAGVVVGKLGTAVCSQQELFAL
ncbi:D-glycero-beta-D-manno-heptose-7-phosphate kinase [Chromobacterium violaceum]|uniref:D-glycero-beta-D-manno-heptose-7-phosphate kinase n=2 Tax=Chromobacterium violaceum TaxID=536 RepID=A0A202BE43_CHRVL|nr:D-glycero-beta-D-manno-heptose-7-phosphate kinase [Chromobacterium violaceum]MBA8736833.1 D-glycero-beta-D-manno-heptose-7-phosphate kinase [Chromobacterium violaceum]OVE49682.1 D-glycero-beta-D-manno-heptose-7-phosphate kinase [Chromobacterium violaceum]QIY80832.1 D-glycero-beta-D-manno-heptose-7-phosphate kinase [Chromobacterium violaceum]SUX39177.1 Bifunctional protein hldE [Chromobacterium violaceum]